MHGTAVILVRRDGAIILQKRDNKPGIYEPGMVGIFGGAVESGETPLQTAVREMGEETDLGLHLADLRSFDTYHEPDALHPGGTITLHCFVAENLPDNPHHIYEGRGFVVLPGEAAMTSFPMSATTQQILHDYFHERKQRQAN